MAGNFLDFEKDIVSLEAVLADLRSPQRQAEGLAEGIDLNAEIARLEEQITVLMQQRYGALSAWEKVQLARHPARPYTLDYVRLVFDEFVELAGDRLGGNDEAVVGGLARLGGEPVVVMGQQKGRDLKERQRRNFGSARAEGFRKALRFARLAEKFGKPLISFVDTAGAAADLAAEERGVSEAIARNLRDLALLGTPIVAVIIGEGGSGGALGMAVADRVLMLEHSVYSVISPEGCAAILWHDRSRAGEAAEALKLTAQSALEMGVIDEVLPEPLGGAHRDAVGMAVTLKAALERHLAALRPIGVEALTEARYQRLRGMGQYLRPPAPRPRKRNGTRDAPVPEPSPDAPSS